MFTIVTAIVMCLARVARAGCPPSDELAPLCDCQMFGSVYTEMVCRKVLNPDQLVAPMRTLSKYHSEISKLQLEDSVLTYFPSDLFEGTSIGMIDFVRTAIMSLSDTDVAFSGLEDRLGMIRVQEGEYVASWNWQQLRNLRKLNIISIDQIAMESLHEPFPHLPSLVALDIKDARLTNVAEGAFSKLPALKILNLQNNRIEELKRNMLPEPAGSLVIVDLSNNSLRSLPEDFFSNMPNIRAVHLDKNQFTTLSENPFKFAFQNLVVLSMDDNPFRCDCRMRWMVGLETSFPPTAECTSPTSLKGHVIASLEMNELWC